MGLRQWLQSKHAEPKAFRVQIDAEGLSLWESGGGERWHVLWRDVVSVTTFKQDLLLYDKIVVEFGDRDGTFCRIDEDVEGFPAVVEKLPQVVDVPADWYIRMAEAPAFEANLTKLFPH